MEGTHESRRRSHCESVCGTAVLGHDKPSGRGTYYGEVGTHVHRLPVSGAGMLSPLKPPITYRIHETTWDCSPAEEKTVGHLTPFPMA